ncbi:MAG: peptidoglycan-binding protein [Oscillibacter sp.]|nr:peptidoglycan-binding protein [Oscillibacter sp.]
MKKRILSVLLAFAMIFTLMPTALAAPTTYQVVTVDKTTVQAGETVNVKVSLPEGIQTAGSFTVVMNFDKGKFEVMSLNYPDDLEAWNEAKNKTASVEVVTNTPDIANVSGQLTANAAYPYNTIQVAGVTVIDATLKAKTDVSGVAAFSFEIFEITYSDNGTQYIVKKDQLETPPSVTIPATGAATLKGIDIITNPALTLAVPTAAPNATATNERSLAAASVYDDGSGGPVAVNWEIMTTPTPKGVSLDGSTLKITNDAEAGTFMIKATSAEGYTDSETVTITKGTPVESAIVLTAPSPATVAVPKSDTPNEIALPTATVYDQYGKPMTGTFSITYAIDGDTPTGVKLDSATGKLTVKRSAQAGEVKVIAKLGTTLTSDPVAYTITRETSKVTYVLVSKLYHNMPVPEVTEPGGTNSADQQFTAEVLDQYLQEMTGQTVTWRVTDTAGKPVHGVSIDNTGKLTVTNEAPGIKVYAIATCQGVDSNNLDMTLHRDTAKATLVEICNQIGKAPENSLLIPAATFTNSENYTAKVYDQYGVHMPGEMVHWALVPATVTGVELDTTISSGNATLKVDSTATSGTTFKLKATTATLGTSGVKELDITLANKAPAQVTTAPAAKTDLKYNGNQQALVTAGAASGGTMQYSLDGTTWSTAVPTGKNVGAYTVQYKVVGDATHTDTAPQTCQMVMISPKFLTMDNLTPTSSTSKVYDGTTNSSITVGVKAGVLFGSDTLTITGTAVYNSANVNEANTITFTPDAITGNYELVPGVLTITGASITPRDLTVTPNAGQSKKFGATDPTLHSTNSGRVTGQIPDFSGALSRAEGEAVGQYDITLGTLALMDHFSSGFKASNYTLKLNSTPVKFEITKADAPTLADITLSQKYTVTTGEKAIGAVMPADAGALTYAKGTESTTGSVTIDSWAVDATGKVTYTLSGGKANDAVTLPVVIKSTNYADATVNVVITLIKGSTSSGGGSYYAPVVPDMPMLYWGCTGDAVKTLQDKLNTLGYNSGNVDGIFGAKTYAAVTAFQKANSLGVDGIVGKLTWGKLYGISPAMPVETTTVVGRPMVSYGSRGDAVRKLQELLNALGYDCGSVDGIFGSKTYAAVLAFQKANGLGADGIVGPLTWAKLG